MSSISLAQPPAVIRIATVGPRSTFGRCIQAALVVDQSAHCDKSGKRRFRTEDEALQSRAGREGLRPYTCPWCCGVHLTTSQEWR